MSCSGISIAVICPNGGAVDGRNGDGGAVRGRDRGAAGTDRWLRGAAEGGLYLVVAGGTAAGQERVLSRLAAKGVVRADAGGWRYCSELLAAYAATAAGRALGRIWLEEATGQAYQGQQPLLDLAPLERSVLHFLIQQPYLRHTKTDLIVSAWPDELRRQGVTDDSLYQVIAGLRKRIEPVPSQPCYVVNWRGRPEGRPL